MIVNLLISAAVATAAPVASPNVQQLVVGAGHAVRANRLDQANLMIARAVAAGASGVEIDRVIADLAYARGNYADALDRYDLLQPFQHSSWGSWTGPRNCCRPQVRAARPAGACGTHSA